MKKQWKCTVCGYIHEGDTPPKTCPICRVGPEMFEDITPKKETDIKKWECSICGYIYEGPNPPDYCPICGVGPELFTEVK
ncbi:rubredoxin-like domain-containing protein [Haloimpatiens sp. FM7315]|uniref:rubredoxin-like domain-containing protein n=1 Tax=Haloimpatiens sp. FM7315 TaxID=3298609 RepID=UPI0035A3859E